MPEVVEKLGFRLVIPYGTAAGCIDAFLRRQQETGGALDADHWLCNNCESYMVFSLPHYSKYRLTAFDHSGRRPKDDFLAEVRRRILG
jgi:hypothetical protein